MEFLNKCWMLIQEVFVVVGACLLAVVLVLVATVLASGMFISDQFAPWGKTGD